MGIPIDGNVNTFTTKLNAKGFKVSPINKFVGEGIRVMEGHFFDQRVDLDINYIPYKKTVYLVRVVFHNDNEKALESLKEEIESTIKDKYYCIPDTGKTRGGDDIDMFHIFKPDTKTGVVDDDTPMKYIGEIYLGIANCDEYYNYELNLTYEDYINSEKNDNSKSDDI